MRKPSLTFETFVTALAVLGAGTSMGCSKAERATAAPEATGVAQPAPPPAAAEAPAEAPPATPLAADPAPQPGGQANAPAPSRPDEPSKNAARGSAVQGAAAPSPKPAGSGTKKASAACGAGGCTPDMKKGNGN